jgi:hypothetical protein
MKTLADCGVAPRHRLHEGPRDVVSVNVMNRLLTQIWEKHLVSRREFREYLRVEIAGGVEWKPAGSHEMPGMQHRRGEPGGAALVQKVGLDGRLAAPVIAERLSWRLFRGGHLHAVTMHPNGSAMKEMLYSPAQGVDQLLGAPNCVAGQIDHNVRPKLRYPRPKASFGFLNRPVECDPNDPRPSLMSAVRVPAAPADANHLVPGLNQLRGDRYVPI